MVWIETCRVVKSVMVLYLLITFKYKIHIKD